MKILLGGKFSGKQIIDAFKRAASKPISSKERWLVEEFSDRDIGIKKYEVINDRLEPVEPEYSLLRVYCEEEVEKKKCMLFGSKEVVWEKNENVYFELGPISLVKDFNEIEIRIRISFSIGGGGTYADYDSEIDTVKEIRPYLVKLIVDFVKELVEDK